MDKPIVTVSVSNRGGSIRGVVFDRDTGAVHAYLFKPMYRGEPMTLSNTASLAREMGFRLNIDEFHASVSEDAD